MFKISVPTIDGADLQLELDGRKVTFLLGANGTGKSSLMDRVARQNRSDVERVYAHRNVTLDSSSISLTGAQRDQFEQTLKTLFVQPQSRYQNQYANQSVNVHLYDLYAANADFSQRQLALLKAIDPSTIEGKEQWDKIKADQIPFQRLQAILNGAGLRLSLQVDKRGKMLAAREGCEPYGIQELSDGERAAFLLAASVITAKQGALVLIDEPERHLHRSISSPLISSLLQDRPDCTFVISTHDVGLPMDHQPSSCILLRQFQHAPQKWEIDVIEDASSIDESIGEAVLGARRTVLFVEGTRTGLDHNLYARLYPEISVRTCQSCREVIQATRGLNEAAKDHWVNAIGVVDQDRRSKESIAELQANHVVCLPVHDVEAVYYHPKVIELVIQRLQKAGTIEASEVSPQLQSTMIDRFIANRDFLTKEAAVRELRVQALSQLPTLRDLESESYQAHTLTKKDLQTALLSERQKFDALAESKDVLGMCAAYPLKKTGLKKAVASLIGLKSPQNYENTVRTMLVDDADAADRVRSILGPLTSKLSNPA